MMEKVGLGGHIKNYDVFISGNTVTVTDQKSWEEDDLSEVRSSDEGIVAKEKVEGLKDFIEEAGEFKIGWGSTPDFEIIYLYDKADDYFGYAVNLADSMLSEWGYAPF